VTRVSAPGRRAALAIALVAGLALTLRTVHLSDQPLIDDDASVGLTAQQFTTNGLPEPTMWNHPRLRDSLVAASLAAFGETPWGLKLWSVLLGAACAPAVMALVIAVGASGTAAVIAGLLVALDPLHLDFSRQAINDVYLAFFPVAALVATWRYRTGHRTGWLVAAGALFGLGLASKWSVAVPLAFAAAVVARDAWRRCAGPGERAIELGFAAAALAVLPLAIYAVTFLPWFGRGYSLAEWVTFHKAMAFETATHMGYPGTKRPGFEGELVGAWRWFLQPVYYADIVAPEVGRAPAYIVGIGNPVAWLAVWPAVAFAGWRALRRRDRTAALLLALFACAYLPFALSVRRPIWTNSAVAVVPFAMALVGFAAAELWRVRRALAGAWMVAAAFAAAVLWFPAAGVSTSLSDPVIHAIVPPIAFVPKHPPGVAAEPAAQGGAKHSTLGKAP
jgi:dolichyl-phosphate-mannose-protein mannosyltransferase